MAVLLAKLENLSGVNITVQSTQYLLLLVITFFTVGILTPAFRRLALKIQVLDLPDQSHKTHQLPIPYLGGVAIAVGIVGVSIGSLLISGSKYQLWETAITLLLPAVLLGTVGLIDDLVSLNPLPRFVAQSIIGLLSAFLISSSGLMGNPTANLEIDVAISSLWIVLICNSINFFDNIDGGAAGACALVALGISGISIYNEQFLVASLSIVTLGGVLGFLLWNKSPAKIYMGDAGSLFLGVTLSVLAIQVDPKAGNQFISLMVLPILFAVPLLDTSVAIISRLARGISPFRGGKDHLSHRLMNRGLDKRRAVFILWSLTAIYVGVATLMAVGLGGIALLVFAFLFWLLLLLYFLNLSIPFSQRI